MVITGDLTQIDLPVKGNSGLYDTFENYKIYLGKHENFKEGCN